MSISPELLEEKLNALRATFLRQLAEKMALIEQCWPAVQRAADAQALHDLYHAVHSLSGSSGALGFAAVSEAAQRLDGFLRPLVQNATLLSAQHIQHIAPLLEDLKKAAGEHVQP